MIELPTTPIDFFDTAIAFSSKTDAELKKAARLFKLMSNAGLVRLGAKLSLLALKWKMPVESIIKSTVFEQFCGGTTLLESQTAIDRLAKYGVQSILDYGAEAKNTEEDFNKTLRAALRAIQFASKNVHIPFISVKITGLTRFELLEKIQSKATLTNAENVEYETALKRLDSICHHAHENQTGVFIDAEESWIQDTIDYFTGIMMQRYNKEQAVVYNTFQLYRHNRLQFLKNAFKLAQKNDYILGAKLVRGAYMEKERARAKEKGYPSPIQKNKKATDKAYDLAVRFCVKHYQTIASCTATHNLESCKQQVGLIERFNLPRNHPHFLFCQLLGMSDNLTFNLAKAGYNAAKYMVYGPVQDVIPFLIRRAQENTAVTGDVSRELKLIQHEMKRRGL